MILNNRRGFTLIEVIVVAGIIAILAGILVPLVFNQIDESKKTRALADIKSINVATLAFRKDVGKWPVLHETAGDPWVDILVSDGTVPALPAGFTAVSNNKSNFKFQMASDALTAPVTIFTGPGGMYFKLWKGPYMSAFPADPWGNAYVMNSGYLFYSETDLPGATTTPVWLLSAGPNGIYETDVTDTELKGDDIGIRLR